MAQNRSNTDYRVDPLAARLPPDFPIVLTFYHHQCWSSRQMQHVHDCLEIGLCRTGSGIFVAGDKILPFAAGDMLVVNSREMHGIRNAEGEESDWNFLIVDVAGLLKGTMEEKDILSARALSGPGFANIIEPKHANAHWLLRRLIAELSVSGRVHRSLVRAHLWALLIELHRLRDPERKPFAPGHLDRIEPALRYLTEHYRETIRIPDVARACHVSEATLRRLFQTRLKCTPQERLARLRIQMACSLLRNTGRKVLDIAMDVGYETPSSFNRQFRLQIGTSAAAWRRALPSGRISKLRGIAKMKSG